ncbi:glycosyltransferase family 2 protein [Dyadobacter subterraneus]|uniref:Glycosyltransferase family 2 protein n=1 Tax=Dyadobacter subterraneus TaxID=2773304 RepID=A0ABR9WEJ5_9BACT|nr:glycosyltransferase family 2 protein [Dyadobacter subterraneus]MBE9463918.1 glycosyltransferase family 2 protein [Dyadobacter subterraneus]
MKKNNLPPLISVVLPCYNPAEGWCQTLENNITELNGRLPFNRIQYIISNDGSTRLDKSKVCVLTASDNVVFLDSIVNEGKGSAIRKGTMRADGDIIIYTDIDFPFGTDPIVEMVKIFNENPDCWFVYGNRTSEYFKKLPLKRQLISKGLHLLNRLFLSGHITDTQAGIKGLRREILPDVQRTKTNTFVFEIELIRKLIKKKVAIQSVNVFANPSIIFSDFSFKVLLKEAVSLSRIFIMSWVWNDVL